MKVLVIGKGGREHALVWKLAQSPLLTRLYCAPGNAGTTQQAENVDIPQNDLDELLRFAKEQKIDLTIVGPEEPLALGIVDLFQKEKLAIFGPTKSAARLESSKAFAKEIMSKADVRTAEFRIYDRPDHAREYVESRVYPVVVKADGLAAGKGAIVCSTQEEALDAINRIMVHDEFGREAGRRIVVEKRLQGEELSALALVGRRTLIPLPPTQDHKPAFDGDTGPNTGGMGAYCPAPLGTEERMFDVERNVMIPTVHLMRREKVAFHGVLYVGIMVTPKDNRVLEYNCRFGDPEAQPLLMRLKSDLLPLLLAIAEDRLDEYSEQELVWDERPSVCVVMASGGYPGKYETGFLINGLEEAAKMEDVEVFHAGTVLRDNREVRTDGGRVLGVTALGDTLGDAQKRAYEAVAKINFPDAHYRTDIGSKALVPE